MYVKRSPIWPDPRVRPRQPGIVEINWGHPLAAGLQFCVLLNESGGELFEMIRQLRGESVSGQLLRHRSSGPQGWVPEFIDETNAGSHFSTPAIGSLSAALAARWTCATQIRPSRLPYPAALARSSQIVACPSYIDSNESATMHFQYDHSVVTEQVAWGCKTTVDDFKAASYPGTLSAGETHNCAGTWDSTNIRAYLNGTLMTASLAMTGPALTGFGISVGTFIGTSGIYAFPGDIYFIYAWNRVLPQHDLSWLAAEPYTFFRAVHRRPRATVVSTAMTVGPMFR